MWRTGSVTTSTEAIDPDPAVWHEDGLGGSGSSFPRGRIRFADFEATAHRIVGERCTPADAWQFIEPLLLEDEN